MLTSREECYKSSTGVLVLPLPNIFAPRSGVIMIENNMNVRMLP